MRDDLGAFTDEEIDKVLLQNGYDLKETKVSGEDVATTNVAPVVWLSGAAIATLVTGALIFSAMYFNHKEKQNLIDKCYENDGYPEVDSRNEAGVEGTTDSAAADHAGGYKFECKKR